MRAFTGLRMVDGFWSASSARRFPPGYRSMRCEIRKKDFSEGVECHKKAVYSVKLGASGRLLLCLKHAQRFEKSYPKIKFDKGLKFC